METEYASHCIYRIRYHIVICLKYRKRLLLDQTKIDFFLWVLKEIGKRYYLNLDKAGTDGDHVHLFLGAAPRYSPSRIIQIIKSITAREMFNMFPEIKQELWGGEFWSDGGYVGTISDQPTEKVIREYIERQGTKQEKEHFGQMKLFDL